MMRDPNSPEALLTRALADGHLRRDRARKRERLACEAAGPTPRFVSCDPHFGCLESDHNVLADLPTSYGAPPKWKFRRGASEHWHDIRPVTNEELIASINRCHQTLWGGGRFSPPAAF